MPTLAWQQLTTTSTPAGRDGHGAAVHPGYSTGGGLMFDLIIIGLSPWIVSLVIRAVREK